MATQLIVRKRVIGEDRAGNLCLSDIWRAGGAPKAHSPFEWQAFDGARRGKAFVTAVYERVFPEESKAGIYRFSRIFYRQKEAPQDWYAHPLIATAYAGYLNPKLEIEIAEIWLRYRAGDPALADEILQNATPAANEWAGTRALSRAVRNEFTDKLRDHDVIGVGYAQCTDAVYRQLLGGAAKQIRDQRGLLQKANVRDALSKNELSFVMAAEALASERITDEDRHGNAECIEATTRSAGFIREAIERDRSDRQRKVR